MRILEKIYPGLIYATLLTPLFITPSVYFGWHFGKTIIFQILVALLVIIMVIRRWSGDVSPRPILTSVDYAITMFVAVLIGTGLTGVDPQISFWGTMGRMQGILTWLHFLVWYWLLRSFLDTALRRRAALAISVAVAALVSLTIIFERWLPTAWQSIAGGGILGNRVLAGQYLLFALGLTLFLASELRSSGWLAKLAMSGTALLIFVTMVVLGARGALVGLFVGTLAALGAKILLSPAPRLRSGRRAFFFAAVLVLAAAGSIWLARVPFVTGRVPYLARLADVRGWLSGSGATRLLAWAVARDGLKERPILGHGFNNFEPVFSRYYRPEFLRYGFSETVWDRPHNWLLDVGVGAGAVGILALLFWFGAALRAFFRSGKTGRLTATSAAIGAGLFVGYGVALLFLFESTNSLLLFVLGSALAAAISVPRPEQTPTQSRSRLVKLGTFLFGTALGLASALSILAASFRPWQTATYLQSAVSTGDPEKWEESAKAIITQDGPYADEAAIFLAEHFVAIIKNNIPVTEAAILPSAKLLALHLLAAADRHPGNPNFSVWAGQIYLALGERFGDSYFAPAAAALERARLLSPQKQDILFLLGRLYLLQKRYDEASAVNAAAVAADPSVGVSHWFLGLTYAAANKSALAVSEIERSRELGRALSGPEELYRLDLYAELKKYDIVIAGYQALVAAEPENVNWYIKLATVYALAGHKTAALANVVKAIELYPPLKEEAEKFIKQYNLR